MSAVLPPLPALVVGHVSHVRLRPVRHAFRYRHFQWLVDLADLPHLRWPTRLLARFDARDHLDGGRLGGGIRGDLDRFLAERGLALDPSDRVLMLAHARVLGHTFDPLSVFWCLRADGSTRAVVFEVHNTFGQRHPYLLDVDERGRAGVDKAFYVSPFNDVSGRYDIALHLDRERVSVRVALDRDGQRVMVAATTGAPIPATPRAIAATNARHLLITYRVSLLIRLHGIRLWRRLPVQARPVHPQPRQPRLPHPQLPHPAQEGSR